MSNADRLNKKIVPLPLKELIDFRIDGVTLAYKALNNLHHVNFHDYYISKDYPLFFCKLDEELNKFYFISFSKMDFKFLIGKKDIILDEKCFDIISLSNTWETNYLVNLNEKGRWFDIQVPIHVFELDVNVVNQKFRPTYSPLDDFVIYNLAKRNHLNLEGEREKTINGLFEVFLINL